MDLNSLDINDAGNWPFPIKLAAAFLLIVAVCGGGYWYDTQQQLEILQREQAAEQKHKQDFIRRQSTLANIDAFRRQISELEGMLATLVAQLPTGTEMPDLLDQVFARGQRNGLKFEIFRPENEVPREFYLAKPITIRAQANFHQFSSFISAVAAMDRIVTLERFNVTFDAIKALPPPTRPGSRSSPSPRGGTNVVDRPLIEATLQTYRYMDEAEAAANAPATPARPGARR